MATTLVKSCIKQLKREHCSFPELIFVVQCRHTRRDSRRLGQIFGLGQHRPSFFHDDSHKRNAKVKDESVERRITESYVDSAGRMKMMQKWKTTLSEAWIPDSSSSVKWIAEHIENSVKIIKNTNRKNEIHNDLVFVNEFERLCQRRLLREPVQYITGEWDFRFINLLMKSPVFIPRPETEGLVDLINSCLFIKEDNNQINVLEIGCGTGAISLSLLHENPQVVCTAIDISKDAVELCFKNSKRLNLLDRINLHHCGVEEIGRLGLGNKFHCIVSNPPYIPEEDMKALQPEVAKYEDQRALCGGADGLEVIKCIIMQAPNLLLPEGCVWLEVDTTHPPMIENLISKLNTSSLQYKAFYNDIYQRPRFCYLKNQTSKNIISSTDVT